MVRKLDIVRSLDNNANPPPTSKDAAEPGATFEEAISATGFGRFNYLLLLLAFPASWCTMISMFNTAFVIPALQCDFRLEIMDIGILNASPFIGNIPGAFIWGYLADTMGRKKLMIYASLADALLNILCAFSPNMWMFAVLKFFSGFTIQGPSAIIMSYMSECHCDKYRSSVILITGTFMGFLNLFLPLLAWGILPMDINYIQPWQLFFLLCTTPSIITGLSFTILPESPKFLMMIGKHDEALNVFQHIYSKNSGKPDYCFPITKLQCEKREAGDDKRSMKEGWIQVKPLFFPPYLWNLILILLMQFFILLGANTLKVWLPELFSLMDEYDTNKNPSATLCQIMSEHLNETAMVDFSNITKGPCIGSQTNDQVYINLCIVGVCSVVMYIIVTIGIFIINKKILLGLLLCISGCCGIALIWCTDPIAILILSALYSTMTGVACVTCISITVDLFPTSFRTLTVSLSLTTGRIGSIIGNLVFPALLIIGCVPPFIFLGGCILACIIPIFLLSSHKVDDV